jgi:hypothetical protein
MLSRTASDVTEDIDQNSLNELAIVLSFTIVDSIGKAFASSVKDCAVRLRYRPDVGQFFIQHARMKQRHQILPVIKVEYSQRSLFNSIESS